MKYRLFFTSERDIDYDAGTFYTDQQINSGDLINGYPVTSKNFCIENGELKEIVLNNYEYYREHNNVLNIGVKDAEK